MPEAKLNIMGEPIGLTVNSPSDNGPSTQFPLGSEALGQKLSVISPDSETHLVYLAYSYCSGHVTTTTTVGLSSMAETPGVGGIAGVAGPPGMGGAPVLGGAHFGASITQIEFGVRSL